MPKLDKTRAIDDINRVLLAVPRKTEGEDWAAGTRDLEECEVFSALGRACLQRWAPPGSPYLTALEARKARFAVEEIAGALQALRDDIDADALEGWTELLHADLFSDFLSQAEHLLAEGYKRAAGVVAGATLEQHLRKLADKHGIMLTNDKGAPAKAAYVNDQLQKHQSYGKAEHTQVLAWLHLRNEAAHPDPSFDERDADAIRMMIQGIRGFVSRYPA